MGKQMRFEMARVGCVGMLLLSGYLVAADASDAGLTPSGAPAPMMKTLTQVEPRVPVTSAKTVISQPGSDYLATNLVAASSSFGIKISPDDETLDLMGFSVKGAGESGYSGIVLEGSSTVPLRGVVVKNGNVWNFDNGIRADYVAECRFEGLTSFANLSYGVFLSGSSGVCYGNTFLSCSFGNNGSHGVFFHGANGRCDANVLQGCTVSENGKSGVSFNGTTGGRVNDNRVESCVIQGNANYGVWMNGNGGQCCGNRMEGCVVDANQSGGVAATGLGGKCSGNRLEGNVLTHNTGTAISLLSANGNVIDSNHIFGSLGASQGIDCSSTASNVVARNSCVGQAINYSLGASDTYGPIATNRGALPSSGKAAHPWANFSR